MKTVIQIVLLIVIIGLSYLLYESIMEPIRFEKQKDKRYKATVERLKQIRDAQVAYKSVYEKYTASFDTLISFVKSDSLRVVKAIGTVPDSFYLQYKRKDAELKAIELGIVSRDTISISVKDSLFHNSFKIDSLRYIPLTSGQFEFELATAEIETGSGVKVNVFEAKAHNDKFLKGLDRQMIVNLNDEARLNEKYPGLKVGSLIAATNNAGNWE